MCRWHTALAILIASVADGTHYVTLGISNEVNLMEPLPKAAMKDKTPYSSLERPIQSPRAAEYLSNALKAMPNNSAIQDSLRKAIFHQEQLQKR